MGNSELLVYEKGERFINGVVYDYRMSEVAIPKELVTELKAIREDLDYIKKRVVDLDTVLTDDDLESLHAAEKDLKEGKTKRL